MSDQQEAGARNGGWVEFQLGGPLFALEVFTDFMSELGAGGAIFSEDPAAAPGAQMVTAFLPLQKASPGIISSIEAKADYLRSEFPGEWSGLQITRVLDRDWGEEWKKGLQPIRLDPGIWIVPSFLEVPAKAGAEPVIRLDPGMAFGTGQHASTRMSVRLLVEEVGGGARSVLDLGTGTGILAMAAALFGATRVLGMDIDLVALRVAGENLEANGLAERVELAQGVSDPGRKLSAEPFDVVVANIFAESLAELLPFIARHMAASGSAVLSGILADRAFLVEDAASGLGLMVARRIEEEGWVTLLLKKESGK